MSKMLTRDITPAEFRTTANDLIRNLLFYAWEQNLYVTEITVTKKTSFYGERLIIVTGSAYPRPEVNYREEVWQGWEGYMVAETT